MTREAQQTMERSRQNESELVYVRDSVVVVVGQDSVSAVAAGRVLWQERWRTELVERVVEKVDTVVQTQTVTRVEERVVEKRVVPRWCWWVLGVAIVCLLALAAVAALRIFASKLL